MYFGKTAPALRLLLVFALATSLLNMGASCVEERNVEKNVFGTIGGVDDIGNNVVTHPTPDRNLAQGIDYFKKADYERAIIAFQKVIVTNPNNEELATAYAGIGWSRAKRSGSVLDGASDFENAYAARSAVQDGKVGLASVYLLRDRARVAEAVSLLESIGASRTSSVSLVDPRFEYKSEIGTGISSARVHALLASCYYFNNQSDKAEEQLRIARSLDPASDRVRSIETAINTLGF